MDINDFKNIVGETKADAPAYIRFFGKITEQSTSQFNAEFEYLQNYIKPSLIRILINSEGGSVLYGMTSYSTIQNSTIPTECIIEGMAASMGSIIWAAGDKSLMRDYSILMIHNPSLPSSDDEAPSELVLAFTKQIETIYRKRFGLTKEKVKAIMDGEAGNDGTFFDASGAVKAGIIPAENVIRTSKQICDKVKNELSTLEDTSVGAIKKCAEELSSYFEVFIADIPDPTKDWEDLSYDEIYQIFSERLLTPLEYRISKVQEQ